MANTGRVKVGVGRHAMIVESEVKDGPHMGRVFSFESHDNFIVGRSKQAHFRLPLKDKFFSRFHFLIEVNPPHCLLIDMGSTNGTKVNGRQITTADLKDGDLIQGGQTVIQVSVEGMEPDPGAAPEPGLSPAGMTETLPLPAHRGISPRQPLTFPEVRLVGSSGGSTDPDIMGCPVCGVVPAAKATPGPREVSSPEALRLCRSCQDLIDHHPQPVPGYLIVRELGRGGMGVVHLALRPEDHALFALKTIKPEVAPNQTAIERFLREARTLLGLHHPNIVSFHDLGEADGLLYFAMDYVSGTDLARLQKERGGPLPTAFAVGLICQLLQALDYTHAKGFVHRDIKPANLLVTKEAARHRLMLADFGLARVYKTSTLSGLTLKGDVGGTAAYMAPEQILEFREAKPQADQYATAATLYKLVTGSYIYDLPRRLDLQLLMILQQAHAPARTRRPDLPAGLADVIDRALAKEPGDRFAGVAEMRRALLPFSKG